MTRRLAVLLPLLAVAACSGERELRCESSERYQGARSVQPIRVPDDLSVPDESNAFRIPPPPDRDGGSARDGCLELPPEYSRPAE
ncbi:MAG TPA: hypothetical protein VF339_05280 [Gammaproteobacteria bacterium]